MSHRIRRPRFDHIGPWVVGALAVVLALLEIPSTRAQGFCHGCSRHATPATPAATVAQAGAESSAEAYESWCTSQFAQLAAPMQEISARCGKTLGRLDASGQRALAQQYTDLLAVWNQLRQTCPTGGAPPPAAPGTAAAAGAASAPPTVGSRVASGAEFALVRLAASVPQDKQGTPASTVGIVPLVIANRESQSIDSTLQHVDNPPPPPSSASPAQQGDSAGTTSSQPPPVTPPAPLPVPPNATPADAAGLGYASALRSERTYVAGFIASYGVYLAARQSKNLVGMLSAAANMGVTIDSALANAHSASDRRHAYLSLIARALGQADSVAKAKRSAPPSTVASAAADSASVSPGAQAALSAAGVPADDVTVAQQAAQAVPAATVRDSATALKSDLRASDSVRVMLAAVSATPTTPDSGAIAPRPPDLGPLLRAKGLALQARQEAARAVGDSVIAAQPSVVPSGEPKSDAGSTSHGGSRWVLVMLCLLIGALGFTTGRLTHPLHHAS